MLPRIAQQVKDAEKGWEKACKDEDKAWPVSRNQPKDPKAYADAITRRANYHSRHLRMVGELEDQKKILNLITDPMERDRWLTVAADYLRGT